jgi:hypothetical protein
MMANENRRASGACRASIFAASRAMFRVVMIRRDAKHVIALDADAMQRRSGGRRVLGRLT